jgi:valyl-tRNA synthetase
MEHYGADGMRFGLMLQVTGAQDLKFAEEKLLSSRNFANKIWNASRFVMMNLEGYQPGAPAPQTVADRWILSRLADLALRVDEGLDTFEFGETARALYDFFWSEYCDWYIELAKDRLFSGTPEQRLAVQRILVFVLDTSLRLLHPMMPFVTEAIWGNLPLPETDAAASLMIASWPDAAELSRFADEGAEATIGIVQDVAVGVRRLVSLRSLHPRTKVDIEFPADVPGDLRVVLEGEAATIRSLANVERILFGEVGEKNEPIGKDVAAGQHMTVLVGGESGFDPAAERARVGARIEKYSLELERLEKKLSNEGFLAKAAPEIVEKDRARATELSDAIGLLRSQLRELD